jgi:hypothetical protein
VLKLLLQFDFLAPSGATRNVMRALDAERAALREVDSVVARLQRLDGPTSRPANQPAA